MSWHGRCCCHPDCLFGIPQLQPVRATQHATANLALMVGILAVSGAIYLILELDQPFGGLIRISSEPLRNALSHIVK